MRRMTSKVNGVSICRCSTMQVYDLAWSPTGEYIITGSTDNTARIFSAADGEGADFILQYDS
jgi:WD40 repeat protein